MLLGLHVAEPLLGLDARARSELELGAGERLEAELRAVLYWNRGQLIRWVQGNTRQPLTKPTARERSNEARESARKLAACAAKGEDSTCQV